MLGKINNESCNYVITKSYNVMSMLSLMDHDLTSLVRFRQLYSRFYTQKNSFSAHVFAKLNLSFFTRADEVSSNELTCHS